MARSTVYCKMITTCLVAGTLAWMPAAAQTDASAISALSALPLASVVASEAGAAVSQASAQVLVAGASLVVRSVASTVRGTVYVLERLSDGVRVSVEVSAQGAGAASLAVGTAVTVSAFAAGVILSAAGQVLAFIPNEVGRALMYNKQLTK